MKEKMVSIFYLLFPIILESIIDILTNKYIGYSNLYKPLFSLPSLLFPIVWSILYLLIVSAYLIWILFATYLTIGIFILNKKTIIA